MGRGPIELRSMAEEWRPVAGTYRKYIHISDTYIQTSITLHIYNVWTNLLVRCIPRSPAMLQSLVRVVRARSCGGYVCSHRDTLLQNWAVEQREDAPRVQKWSRWAQTDSPELGECRGRGPTELRSMAGEWRPVAGTYRKYIHISDTYIIT